jgi:hypothetical protein
MLLAFKPPTYRSKAKEPTDDLVAAKKELDVKVDAIRKEAKEFEAKMRQKASTVGNIVGKDAPVSQTEVRGSSVQISIALIGNGRMTMSHSGRGFLPKKRRNRLCEPI